IGTMNPDEGELRPQLLDRFGLSVGIHNLADPVARSEVVARAIDFESAPEKFIEKWTSDQNALGERIAQARRILPEVVIADNIAAGISELCCREHVEGMRADIVIRKSAMTHAAWEGRSAVTQADVERVMEFALAHRRNNPPEPPPPPPPPRPKDRGESQSENSPENSSENSPESPDPPREDSLSQLEAQPEGPVSIPHTEARIASHRYTPGGRAGRERPGTRQGPYVRAGAPQGKATDLALDATLRAAAIRSAAKNRDKKNGFDSASLSISPEDFRVKIHKPPHRRLFLFVLDASRSMGARRRMEVTKGMLLGLLDEAYQKRDEVGLIVMQGAGANLVLPPTRSVRRVQAQVRDLPVGGRTPLAHGLRLARETLVQSERRQPGVSPSLILVSDGRPTLGIGDIPPIQAAERELAIFSQSRTDLLLVDTEAGQVRLGMMPEWGRRWNFSCAALDELRPGSVRRLLNAA
ncbi:MAG: VWA domain-containing protein, partial [Nitrospinaceae bacterium]|nr:VWA domain-containing protein [Nitrospinaceae bacterium]